MTDEVRDKRLKSLLDTISTWLVTESGPTQMKISIPDLQVSVSFHGYRKLVIERTFPKGKSNVK